MDKLPGFLKSALWSYDLSTMDKNKNAVLIITQVLSHGNPEQIAWLKHTYSVEQIKKVLLHPHRGVWHRDRLRQWLTRFDMVIDPLEFETAVLDMNLRPRLMQEFWRRKDRTQHASFANS